MERTLEDAKENCEHILKVNVAYIEKLQVSVYAYGVALTDTNAKAPTTFG